MRLRPVAGARRVLREVRWRRAGDYAAWVERYDRVTPTGGQRVAAAIEGLAWRPRFSVIGPREALAGQLYPDWEAVADAAVATGDFLLRLRPGDRVAETALFAVAAALQEQPEAALVLADYDRLDGSGRRAAPCFHPGWSPTLHPLLLAGSPALLQRRDAGAAAGPMLRVPQILLHLAHDGPPTALETPPPPAPLPPGRQPPVSVVVPTRDRLPLLREACRTVLEATDYPALELLVVDNGSEASETRDYLAGLSQDPRVQVLRRPGAFNFAALNNAAARAARGPLLCLLNNDVEGRDPGWLAALVARLQEPGVGAAGARLLYPDGRLQHAGVVLGLDGVAGHLFRGLPSEGPEAPAWSLLPRDCSALTAACLLLRRDDYLAVGGMDEAAFPVAYNDVDLCLKLGAAGLRLVYCPEATLIHHEKQSRGSGDTAAKRARTRAEAAALAARWLVRPAEDPHYNPNLTLDDERGGLAWPPRVARPWARDDGGSDE